MTWQGSILAVPACHPYQSFAESIGASSQDWSCDKEKAPLYRQAQPSPEMVQCTSLKATAEI